MTISQIQQFFLWGTVLNYVVLIAWWVIMLLPHAWLYNLSAKRFGVSLQTFDAWNLCGIGLYKVLIVAFFLVPYAALRIAG